MLKRLTLIFACVFLIGGVLHAQTDAAHPHLWITAQDLPRLRAWAAQNNPLYTDGLWVLANEAATLMDEGVITVQGIGSNAYDE